jgi:hypothetical protein
MGVLLVLLVVIVVIAAAATAVSVKRAPRRLDPVDEVPARTTEHAEPLTYVVPEGQDPAAVLAAFSGTAFEAAVHEEGSERVLVVTCPRGADRDRDEVRARIQGAGTVVDAPVAAPPVRFADE